MSRLYQDFEPDYQYRKGETQDIIEFQVKGNIYYTLLVRIEKGFLAFNHPLQFNGRERKVQESSLLFHFFYRRSNIIVGIWSLLVLFMEIIFFYHNADTIL